MATSKIFKERGFVMIQPTSRYHRRRHWCAFKWSLQALGYALLLLMGSNVVLECGQTDKGLTRLTDCINDQPIDVDEVQRLADAGDSEAQLHIGLLYLRGSRCRVDIQSSRRSLLVASDTGSAEDYLRRSANQGNLSAMMFLADLYAAGYLGIHKSNRLAYFWASIAVANGYKDGERLRDRVKQQLSMEEIIRIEDQVSGWMVEMTK